VENKRKKQNMGEKKIDEEYREVKIKNKIVINKRISME